MKGFLEYKSGNSIFHKMNPLTKLALSVVLCVMCIVSSNIFFVLGIIVINILIAAAAGIHKLAFTIISGILKMSVLIFILQVLFTGGGEVVFRIGSIIKVTDKGIYASVLLVLRLIATALPLSIMLSVTQMGDLSNVLVSKLHVPYKYAFAIITVIRFIPVFANEMAGIMESQTARGVEFDTKNLLRKVKLIIPLCVPLLISSVKRIDSTVMAAELRGFYRRKPGCGYKTYAFTVNDIFAVLICAVVITAGIII